MDGVLVQITLTALADLVACSMQRVKPNATAIVKIGGTRGATCIWNKFISFVNAWIQSLAQNEDKIT